MRYAIRYEDVQEQVERVFNHLCLGQQRWLFEKSVALADDAVILEVGTHRGGSTIPLGIPCVGTHRRLFGLDIRNDAPSVQADWLNNVRIFGLEPYVVELVGASQSLLQLWHIPIDFAFIDGSHRYDDVLSDYNLIFPWIKQGGEIALHDVCPPEDGPTRVWNEVASKNLIAHEQFGTIMCGRKP